MSWTEILIDVGAELAEPVSDALMEAGALSVSLEDADFGTEHENPIFDEPGIELLPKIWAHNRLVALIAEDAQIAPILKQVMVVCALRAPLSYTTRRVDDCDWVRMTQSQFEPMKIGQYIWVVPSWHATPDPAAMVLALDPGLAFGTGSHPTTRLCMEWLEQIVEPRQRVLDYGCGSGILAIVASKMQASEVIGVDIEDQAIISARENAQRNACVGTFVLQKDFAAQEVSQFDIIVANILTEPLKLLAPFLCQYLKPSARICLSGVLSRQTQDVILAYSRYIRLETAGELDGWVALTGQR